MRMLSYIALASGLALGSLANAEPADPTAPVIKLEQGQTLYVVPVSATIKAKPTIATVSLPITADCYPTAPEALNALGNKQKELLDKLSERLKELKSALEPKDIETANLVTMQNEEYEWLNDATGRGKKGRPHCKKDGKKWSNHRATYTLKLKLKALEVKENEAKDLTAKLANSSWLNVSTVLATYAEIVNGTPTEEFDRAPYVTGGQQRTVYDNTDEEKRSLDAKAKKKAIRLAFVNVLQQAEACDANLEAFRQKLVIKSSELVTSAYQPQFEAAEATASFRAAAAPSAPTTPPPTLPSELSYTATYNVKLVGPALTCPAPKGLELPQE